MATGIAAATGTIQGTAADAASHKPVGSAIVTAVRAGLPPLSQTVTAGPDGTYGFSGLPAGTYTLCAQALAAGYLNPCEFASVPVTVSLSAGQKSGNNVVGMVAGSVLHVRIQDPQQLVALQTASQKTGGAQSPDINVGVWGPGNPGTRFFPARLTGTDSAGLDFQVTIPQDTSLALHVSSRHLKLAGVTGSGVAGAALEGNASQVKFQHKTGDVNPVSFTFAVTAVIP
jgi:Carboxypeptidase regulatory-like domain